MVVNLMDGDGNSSTDDDPDSCSGDVCSGDVCSEDASADASVDDTSANHGTWADGDGRMPRIELDAL